MEERAIGGLLTCIPWEQLCKKSSEICHRRCNKSWWSVQSSNWCNWLQMKVSSVITWISLISCTLIIKIHECLHHYYESWIIQNILYHACQYSVIFTPNVWQAYIYIYCCTYNYLGETENPLREMYIHASQFCIPFWIKMTSIIWVLTFIVSLLWVKRWDWQVNI